MPMKQSIDLISASGVGAEPWLADHADLAARCGAIVPLNWPAGGLLQVVSPFAGRDDRVRDYWYALACDMSLPRLAPFVVGGGAIALPRQGATDAELAFRLLPQFQGHDYGRLIAEGLVERAFAHGEVERIRTAVSWEDGARVHVLSKIGFVASPDAAASACMAMFVLERNR